MPLQGSGAISLPNIQGEFGGANPISLSEYYKGGAYVTYSDVAPNVPTGGTIRLSNFYGASRNVVGQTAYTSAGTFSWTVPAGVTSICVVCVGSGNSTAISSVTYGGTTVCRAQNGARIGDGGGDGGAGGDDAFYGGGGGGAGGYSGSGGAGANSSSAGVGGASGSGGGGGGGGIDVGGNSVGGGGVGLLGQGTSGAGASPYAYGGNAGSGGASTTTQGGGLYGGGTGGPFATRGLQGGALAYKNNISVTPGASVTVAVGGNGAVRIIYGSGRAFPSTNTGDM